MDFHWFAVTRTCSLTFNIESTERSIRLVSRPRQHYGNTFSGFLVHFRYTVPSNFQDSDLNERISILQTTMERTVQQVPVNPVWNESFFALPNSVWFRQIQGKVIGKKIIRRTSPSFPLIRWTRGGEQSQIKILRGPSREKGLHSGRKKGAANWHERLHVTV